MFSAAQLKHFEEVRNFMVYSANKYDNKIPIISLIFGFWLLAFASDDGSGNFCSPVRICDCPASVSSQRGNGQGKSPLGAIQVIEARVDAYTSQGGINRRGHQSPQIAHVLQMDSIKFNITSSFREVIQPKRLYRVYAVKDQGAWTLLSMEAFE